MSHDKQPSESLFKSLKIVFVVLQMVFVLLVVAFLATGYFTVDTNNQSLSFVNGKLKGEAGKQVYKAGEAYWIWPRPIGSTLSIESEDTMLTTETTTFHYDDSEAKRLTNPDKMNEDDPYARLILGKHGYLVSADSYIFHLKASLHYHISDAVQYYRSFHQKSFETSLDGEQKEMTLVAHKVLNEIIDDVLIEQSSMWNVDDIFYRNPNGFRLSLERKLKEKVRALAVGINIQRVDIPSNDLKSPRMLQGTFSRLVSEKMKSESKVYKALQEKEKITLLALQDYQKSISKAETYKAKIIASTQSQSERVAQFSKLIKEGDQTILLNYYMETLRDAVNHVDKKIVVHHKKEGKMNIRLLIDPEDLKKKEK